MALVTSIIATVMGLLLGVLGAFPLLEGKSRPVAGSPSPAFSGRLVREVGEGFTGAYVRVVEELLAQQRHPDYQRAERERQAMLSYAASLVPQFQGLARTMEGHLPSPDIGPGENARR